MQDHFWWWSFTNSPDAPRGHMCQRGVISMPLRRHNVATISMRPLFDIVRPLIIEYVHRLFERNYCIRIVAMALCSINNFCWHGCIGPNAWTRTGYVYLFAQSHVLCMLLTLLYKLWACPVSTRRQCGVCPTLTKRPWRLDLLTASGSTCVRARAQPGCSGWALARMHVWRLRCRDTQEYTMGWAWEWTLWRMLASSRSCAGWLVLQ